MISIILIVQHTSNTYGLFSCLSRVDISRGHYYCKHYRPSTKGNIEQPVKDFPYIESYSKCEYESNLMIAYEDDAEPVPVGGDGSVQE